MNVDWDRVAKDADNGLGAKLAELQLLQEQGRVTSIVIGLDFKNAKGAPLLSVWYPKGASISALGLIEFAKAEILRSYNEEGMSHEEAAELEPDE